MSYSEDNAAASERILALVAHLSDAEMAVPDDDGWTVSAQLAHLAFWDRVHVGRLRAALEAGEDLPDRLGRSTTDAINDSSLHGWRLIPGDEAIRLFAEASAEVDAYVASLAPAVVERVRAAGLERTVERHRHRSDHGGAIAAAVHRAAGGR